MEFAKLYYITSNKSYQNLKSYLVVLQYKYIMYIFHIQDKNNNLGH
jgi:hypothetical protein